MLIHMIILAACVIWWPDEPINKLTPEQKAKIERDRMNQWP